MNSQWDAPIAIYCPFRADLLQFPNQTARETCGVCNYNTKEEHGPVARAPELAGIGALHAPNMTNNNCHCHIHISGQRVDHRTLMRNGKPSIRWSVIGDQPASDWRPSGGRWPTWGSRSAFLCPILLFLISFRPGSWWVCHFGLKVEENPLKLCLEDFDF